MRILFCTNSIGAMGGIERVTIVKANALSDISDTEVAICYTDKGRYPVKTIHPLSPKVKVLDLGVSFWDLSPLSIKNLIYTAPKKFFALRKAICSAIRDFCPDVVVSTGTYEKYALASINPSKITLKKTVKVREYHFGSNYRKYISQTALTSIAGFIDNHLLCQCYDMNYLLTKEDIDSNFRGRKGFDYQHNPVSFSTPHTMARKNVVVSICRLVDQKNISSMLRAWSLVADKAYGWQLWIAGEGDQRHMLKKMAKDSGIDGSVRFLGFCPHPDRLLCESKIAAFTSKYEGMSLSLIEAMACGTVPVSYLTPFGPADIVSNGIDGILTGYNDEESFARQLLSLMLDPDRIETMSLKAMEKAKTFTPDVIARQWIEKYTALLSL